MRTLRNLLLISAVLALTLAAAAQQNAISTIIGGGPNNVPALDADLNGPQFVAFDTAGNYYVSDFYNNRVFKVNASGTLTVLAGSGLPGYSGDGGPATQANLYSPEGVAVDSSGNVYIADYYHSVIRMVNSSGTISTVAGTGTCTYDGDTTGSGGDGNPATQHSLCYPVQITLDSSGDLFIADSSNYRIRKLVISSDSISTVAGDGTNTACADGTLATNCGFYLPYGIAVDSSGDLFISDTYDWIIRKVAASTGKVKTIAGTLGTAGFTGDGGKATLATLYYPEGLSVDAAGANVWVADTNDWRIREFPVGGNINTVAGGGGGCAGQTDSIGDGCPAIDAYLYYPISPAVDSAGNLYIADQSNYRVRKVDSTQTISTVAGNGSPSQTSLVNGIANGITLYTPWGIVGDPSGNLFVANQNDYAVQELVLSSSLVNIIAGTGTAGYNGDGIPANTAELYSPAGVARDSSGNIYIADQYNSIIRKVDGAGNISTVAGVPSSIGYSGDGGPATSAWLYYPAGVFVDASNNLYIADTYNEVIRKVSGGTISTVAGTVQNAGYGGDGGPATSANLYYPSDVKVDSAGNIYIADTDNNRIRRVSAASGNISTVAGNGTAGFSGDGIATQNYLYQPLSIWLDANDNLFIDDQYNHRIRMVDGGGSMTTVAGNGTAAFAGDGGPAINASFYYPYGVYVDGTGNLFVTDSYNYRVRKINAFAAVGRSTGSLSFGISPVGTTATPQAITLSGVGPAAISSITATGDFSEVDDCSGSLPNGSNCTVYVYFTPTASGIRTGTLTINSNGYFASESTVALQGEGSALSLTGTLAFGSVTLNTPSTKSVTLQNLGSTSVTISSITLTQTTNYAFSNTSTCPLTGGALAGKLKCTIVVTFTPHSTGVKKGTLVVNSNDPASPLLLGYSGTGSSFESFTPASVTFATTVLNANSKATKVAFKYTGTSSLTLTSLVASANYSLNITGITTGACNLSGSTALAAGGSCAFNVVFTPTAINTTTGTVTASFTGDPNNSTLALPLTGVGMEVTFSPASLSFGNVVHGTTKSLNLTVKNVSLSNTLHVTGTSFTGTYASVYSVTANTCAAVAPGTTCTLTVQFAPVAAGTAQKAVLNVTDDGGGSPQLVNVTGNGT
ncbi:MAG: choice-of-anchor D domain-containing protein [Terriglobales bacterium]